MPRIPLVLALLLLAGCATRPPGIPRSAGAALDPASPPAPRGVVVRALTSSVPLPGESTDGWSGLDADSPAPPPNTGHDHSNHAGHGGGGAP